MTGVDVLIYAEDPGGANMLAPLPRALQAAGIAVHLIASPVLARYLDERGVQCGECADRPDDVLSRLMPRLVVVGTSENSKSLSLAFTRAARVNGIASVGVVDMVVNADRRFRGDGDDPLAHAPDWIAVPDEPTADAYRALGFPPKHIAVCGHPHYDVVRDHRAAFAAACRDSMRSKCLLSVPTDRPVLIFLAEGIDRLNPAASRATDTYTLRGTGASADRTTIVLEEVLMAADDLNPRPYVVLRLHPKNAADDYGALRGRIDMVSKGGDPLPLLWCADLVVGMTTFLLVEAFLLERPTLSVLPRAEEAQWLPTTRAGLTPVATTREDLRARTLELLRSQPSSQRAAANDLLPPGAIARHVSLITDLLETSM